MSRKVPEVKKYLFGPVPSRRLGLSLGVDIVPFKVCTLDCVYCQLGKTTEKTIERRYSVPVEDVLSELKERLTCGLKADFITISGSGEPTLNIKLGEVIKGIKKITRIPVAILTNGTLFDDKKVRAECALADVVLPSLDAGNEQSFQRINRPCKGLSIEKLVSGLCSFRDEFSGQIWLEVFIIEGFNTNIEQIGLIRGLIERIRPDKVQLNMAVRPVAEKCIRSIEFEKLQTIAVQLGNRCEVIADYPYIPADKNVKGKAEYVLSLLNRRPCCLDDICSGLGIHRNEALKHLSCLQRQGIIYTEEKGGKTFYAVRLRK